MPVTLRRLTRRNRRPGAAAFGYGQLTWAIREASFERCKRDGSFASRRTSPTAVPGCALPTSRRHGFLILIDARFSPCLSRRTVASSRPASDDDATQSARHWCPPKPKWTLAPKPTRVPSPRGGRVCLDRNRRWISGASAGCRSGLPCLVGTQGGRGPTGVPTRQGGEKFMRP